MAKIFEPLFSTKQFGVGLPTVRQIMEKHGGGFEITNGESGGASPPLQNHLNPSHRLGTEERDQQRIGPHGTEDTTEDG